MQPSIHNTEAVVLPPFVAAAWISLVAVLISLVGILQLQDAPPTVTSRPLEWAEIEWSLHETSCIPSQD